RDRPPRQRPAAVRPAPAAPAEPVLVRGQRMYLHDPARDRWVSRPLLLGQPYEPYETDLVLGLAREGDVVVDLGANLASYPLLLARQVGPSGKVFAFEPDPDNFALLARNVEANGYQNVVLINKAASDQGGTARLHKSADNQGDPRLYASPGVRPFVEVQCV